jgi:hypothetical protein
MKRTLTAFCAAFMAISCTIMPEPVPVNVIFMGKAPAQVKSGAWDDDQTIGKLDLLVYRNRDGMLLYSCSRRGNLPLEVCVPAGEECRWYLIANAAEPFGGCTTLEEFLLKEIHLQDGPVMHSEGVSTFTQSGTTVQAQLSRYACKVGLGSICMNWDDAFPCTLDLVALTNVLETTSPGQSLTNTYYNCGVVSEDFGGLVAQYPGLEINSREPFDVGTTLFCIPSDRTRLALCITARDGPNWYPIDLPHMEGNRYYLVDKVVINGPGAPGADVEIERVPMSFTLGIKPWEENSIPIQL